MRDILLRYYSRIEREKRILTITTLFLFLSISPFLDTQYKTHKEISVETSQLAKVFVGPILCLAQLPRWSGKTTHKRGDLHRGFNCFFAMVQIVIYGGSRSRTLPAEDRDAL